MRAKRERQQTQMNLDEVSTRKPSGGKETHTQNAEYEVAVWW
jgi:hypothetical protein